MKRYESYKDSGVKWLGEIPGHWEVYKLKYLFRLNKIKNVGNTCNTILSLSYGKIIIKKDINEGLTPESYESYQLLNKGDIVIRSTDLQNDHTSLRTGLVKSDGAITSAYIGLKNLNVNLYDSRYYHYFLHDWDITKAIYNEGKGLRQSLNWDDIKNMLLPVLDINEQTAIANYLDSVTSKIDEAISQQQKMIDLLNERKQIIINNAVTKGLNPDAPMKDSGVDWIGEIPEHWIITKLKHLVEITDGTHDTPRYVDPSSNTYPLVTSRCIVNGVIDLSLANHITEQDYNDIATRSYVRRNDVIMPMIGTVGNPAIVDFEDSIAIKNVALFRTNGNINIAKFLKYLLNSSVVKEQFAMYNKGGVQNFVSQEILKNLAIIVPDNITDVVGFLEREIAKIETPIIAYNQQISLLQERKQIIINDVVTGKVKVC